MRNCGRCASPRLTLRRNARCEMRIIAQVPAMPMPARLITISNAFLGTRALRTTPSRPNEAVTMMPPAGTLFLLRRAAKRGPSPTSAIERSVRPVAYRPALSEDRAAVRTTTCMMSPAWGTPMPEKNVVKGDSFDE